MNNQITWKKIPLVELLDYEQPTNYIVENTNYNDNYKTPVLTAGKSFLLGRTNETEGIFQNLPVIIFDDFTIANKFVDFEFKVKSSAMKLLRPKNELIDLKYIYLMIQGIKLNRETHKRYYLSKYQNREILMPLTKEGEFNLEKQKQIVSILEKVEKLKEKRKESEEILEESLKAIFYEMFLNKEFEKVNLGNKKYFEVQSGGTPSKSKKDYWIEGDIPWIGSTECKDKLIKSSKKFITSLGLENSSAKIFSKGTVLVALVGATIGKTGILNFDCSTNQNIAGIKILNNKIIDENYLFFLLRTLYYKFISLSKESFKMATLSFVRSLEVPLPPLPLQEKFASIVKHVEKLKEKQKTSKKEIDDLFDVLMQKTFRGELI
jgi:type I restriction enzyme, S subunit